MLLASISNICEYGSRVVEVGEVSVHITWLPGPKADLWPLLW